MSISRSALDRLPDPENLSLTLGSLSKVAFALGKRVHVEFVDEAPGRVARRRSKGRRAA